MRMELKLKMEFKKKKTLEVYVACLIFHGNAVRISKLSYMFNELPHMVFKRFSPF